ncbi:MAG: tripartite tricarboxylate transporter permease, partial [Firmicutes bacterium]|nr:tripartite tricarboxylate transporter permease [Bacillota bacterium]
LAIVGTYSLNNSIFDVWVMLVAGILGYVLRNSGYDPAPLILGMVLGPMIMKSFHQSLIIFNGNALNLWLRPISGVMMTLSVVITLVFPLIKKVFAAKRDDLAVGTGGPGL